MKPLLLATILSAALALPSLALQPSRILGQTVTGSPGIDAIDVISFGPGGILFLGCGARQEILALDLAESPQPANPSFSVEKLQSRIAQRLGAPEDGVEILDLAVNPVSHLPLLAVRKQNDKAHLLLRVLPDGSLEQVLLQDLAYARIPLPQGEEAPVSKITGIAWAGDRLVAAARCNEEFASKIFAADGPLIHDRPGQIYSAETYHVAHGKWETRAPMSVIIPYEEDGQHFVVGAFSCTPVVKYPINSLLPGARIKGLSMLELGSGNRPLDMFAYGQDGKSSVLTNTFRFHHDRRPLSPSPHLAFRFDSSLLGENELVNEKAIRRLSPQAQDRVEIAEDFHGVIHMDFLTQGQALALRERPDGDLDLTALSLP